MRNAVSCSYPDTTPVLMCPSIIKHAYYPMPTAIPSTMRHKRRP